ncbi:MAG: polysaccharide pyruvyl transferase family protein [Bdellovibrionota bacterium]
MTAPRIGILTFHHSLNYGAVLQSYALCRVLRERGMNAEIIDYRPAWTRRFYFNPMFPRSLHEWRRRARFKGFLKGLRGFPYYSRHQLKFTKYDLYIAGSDQIWNPDGANGYDPSLFLDFVRSPARRVAYAASASGAKALHPGSYPLLARFDRISVRDRHTQDLVAPHFSGDVSICLDPTLLFDWSSIAGDLKEAHILVHTPRLQHKPEMSTAVRALQARCQLPMRAIEADGLGSIETQAIRDAGPAEWVKAIAQSSHVVTNRYHAFIFSLILGKKILWLNRKDAFHKVYALLQQLGIPITPEDFSQPVLWFDNLDYGSIQKRLGKLRSQSLSFLEDSLKLVNQLKWGDKVGDQANRRTAS